MTIKKIFTIAPFLFLIVFGFPVKSIAAMTAKPTADSTENTRMLSNIISRVTEIQNMDKSNLTSVEKKELKKELKSMKQKAEGLDRRVYLSVGAIIIIILLLILIL